MAARWAQRAWSVPVTAHCLALLVVLVGLAAVVGTESSYIDDEGAAVVQARHLADHNSWIVPHPLPEVDPTGLFYPYKLSEAGERGAAPFAKHPVYAVVLASLWRIGGIKALLGLSLLGTVLAGLTAGLLAGRIDSRFARPAVWAVGLGSPLLFDGYLVLAHTVGAALGGALVLVLTRREGRGKLGAVAGAAALAAGLVLMRSEGALLVGAAAVAAFVPRRTRWLAIAAASGGAGAFVAERLWVRSIVGAPVASAVVSAGHRAGVGGVRGRVNGAWATLVRPGYSGGSAAEFLLLVALVAFVFGVLLARQRSVFTPLAAVTASACVLLRLAIAPAAPVPGMLVACPILLVGGLSAAVMRARSLLNPVHVALLGLFVLGVLATQYEHGGGLEWGGRYFAIALPLAIPIALVGLAALPRSLVVGVAVATLALSTLAVAELRDTHRATTRVLDAIDAEGGALAITTAGELPRLDWAAADRRQWLLVPPDDVATLLRRLPAAGVHRVVVVYPDSRPPRGWTDRGRQVPGLRWRIVAVEL
ncbi:MAG: hypothetical protein QOI61_2211 [Actinomycetota bacterium]|jgi:phosphohistidine swiveling domain-containing protein